MFIDKYLELDFNGTEAARRAGYKGDDNTLASIASQNLRKLKIRQRIEQRLNVQAMSANEVLWRLGEQGRTNPDDFFDIDDKGLININLDKAKQSGKLQQVKKIKFLINGSVELEFYDAQRALELIGKAHGLFRERQYNLDVDLSQLTVEQLERISRGDDPAAVLATES